MSDEVICKCGKEMVYQPSHQQWWCPRCGLYKSRQELVNVPKNTVVPFKGGKG